MLSISSKNLKMTNVTDILIVGPSWVGDMVMAQVLFKHLKKKYPNAALDVLAPEWSLKVVAYMPEVRNAILLPCAHKKLGLLKRYRLAKTLKNKYAQAIVLPNSFKSALIPFWAGIPKRTGWRGELRYGLLNDVRTLNKAVLPLMMQRYLALGLDKGETLPVKPAYPEFNVSLDDVASALSRFELKKQDSDRILAMCPGAVYGPAKRWPAHYCAELIQRKQKEGWQVWLFGSDQDRDVLRDIDSDIMRHCVDLMGTTLEDTIHLMSCVTVVVSNDSGLMHIASALNKPTIVLYGSTTPHFTPPLNNSAKTLWLGLECSPCFQRMCPLKHFECMMGLTPDRVNKELEALV